MRTAINFGQKYSKLDLDNFSTVRWIDFDVKVGNYYDVFLVAANGFHTHYGKGKVRCISVDLVKLKDLSDTFCKFDADCSKSEFLELMRGWYGKKKEWCDLHSEVLVIYLERVK